ncbi:MAG: hypothetical protein JEZ08_22785 [Clostridiales bacterium]|nr:hypothetical protein [Clostridiales bacterium]
MIKVINDPVKKSEICLNVLRDLPEWFGIEESLLNYVEHVKSLEFICYEVNQIIMCTLVKTRNSDS